MAANVTRMLVLVAVAWAVSARVSRGQAPGRRAVSPPAGFTNSVGMRLVQIPAGEFVMGRRSTFDELAQAYPLYQEKSGRHGVWGDEHRYPPRDAEINRFWSQHSW